jgi:hypothetical protein
LTVCDRYPDLVEQYQEEAGLKVKVKYVGDGEAGKELSRKIQEFVESPKKTNKYGVEITDELTYSEAFKIVCEKNPDLVKQYMEDLKNPK